LLIPLLANSHIFEISEDDHPRLVTDARDHWWTLDLANASLSPGVNSRMELVPSPRADARSAPLARGWQNVRFLKFLLFYSWRCKNAVKISYANFLMTSLSTNTSVA
jgi:hypothetical protein